jgi:hypothetical protein
MLGQFPADVPDRHQEGRGEGGAWPSASFIPPDPLAVQDEVPELLGAVEAGSGAVVLSVLRTTTVHVHWSGVWGSYSTVTVSSVGGVSA